MSSPVINSTARGLSLFPPIFYTFLLLFLVAHWAAEGDKNVISRTVTKRKKKCRHSWLGWLSRLCALLVQLQLDTRLSFAWSHYITHSLQLSSFIASFRQADSPYTHVAVNTSTQCLSQNCPHHHVYQDQWVARYNLPGLTLAEHIKCHLCFLKGLFWSSCLDLKTLNMVEWIQMPSEKYGE